MNLFIETSREKIREAIYNNKLVVFVGSGISYNSGMPTWDSLIKTFADELGIPFDPSSIDEFIKIPQYYFNERKSHEYYKTLKNIFDVPNKTNILHELIFSMHPIHIITTNFDRLLEEFVNQKGLNYHTVKRDNDLPYAVENRMIIKMHGDIEEGNIVLKEDDYLNYSNNFKLIENYVKSLFATHIILFVGFSADDPNFKIIFNWVKNNLQKDFQPAYLLESIKNKDQIKFNYYKNRGINILYFEELTDEDLNYKLSSYENKLNTLNSDIGINLAKFLIYLSEDEELTIDNLLKRAYKFLSVFDELNNILQIDLVSKLRLKAKIQPEAKLFPENAELLINDNVVYDFIYKLNNDSDFKNNISEKKEFKYIEKCLNHSKINKIKAISVKDKIKYEEIFDFDTSLTFYNDDFNNLIKSLESFEMDKFENDLSNYLFDIEIEGNEFEFLGKSHLLFKTGRYAEAHKLLREISKTSIRNKKFLTYAISELNILLNLSIWRIDIFSGKKYDPEIIQKAEKEIRNIDLENIYKNLPSSKFEVITFFNKIAELLFLYKYQQMIRSELSKNLDAKIFLDSGGWKSDLPDIKNAYLYIHNLYYYNLNNHLFIDYTFELKSIYEMFIETSLINYSFDIKSKSVIPITKDLSRLNNFNYFIIHIMITQLSYSRLDNLLKQYLIDTIEIEIDCFKKMLYSFTNIIKSLNKNQKPLSIYKYWGYITNFLLIFSKLNLNKEEFKELSDRFQLILDIKKDPDTYFLLNSILLTTYKRDKKLINLDSIKNILLFFLKNYISKLPEYFSPQELDFIDNLYYIIREEESSYFINDSELTDQLLKGIRNSLQDKNTNKAINLSIFPLIYIYLMSDINDKYKIELLYKEVISNKDVQNNELFIELFNNLIKSKIIIPSHENTKSFINKIQDIIKTHDKLEVYPNPIERGINILTELILLFNLDVKNFSKEIKEFSKYNSTLDFVINKDNYDYDNFNPDLLNYLPDYFIKEIFKDERIKLIILNKIQKLLMDDSKNIRLKKIFFNKI